MYIRQRDIYISSSLLIFADVNKNKGLEGMKLCV